MHSCGGDHSKISLLSVVITRRFHFLQRDVYVSKRLQSCCCANDSVWTMSCVGSQTVVVCFSFLNMKQNYVDKRKLWSQSQKNASIPTCHRKTTTLGDLVRWRHKVVVFLSFFIKEDKHSAVEPMLQDACPKSLIGMRVYMSPQTTGRGRRRALVPKTLPFAFHTR